MKTAHFFIAHFAAMLMLICSSSASAQITPVRVDVELSRSRVYLGDSLTYQVIVRGSDDPGTPQVAFPPTVKAAYNGRSSQSFTKIQVINGKRKTVTDRNYSYQYTLTPIEAGTIHIPAPVIKEGGQSYTGKATSFESILPNQSDIDDFEIHIKRTDLYRGESVEVECTWWIGAQTTEFSFHSSQFPDSFLVTPLKPLVQGQQTVRVLFQEESIVGVVGPGQHNGTDMTRLVFRFNITPQQTGSFALGPIRVVFTRRSGTNQLFRAYVESEPISVSVRPVPEQGRPTGYMDAVGPYRVSLSASNTTVNVGDPIELTYRVIGQEPMDIAQITPNLSGLDGFAGAFKVSSDGWRERSSQAPGVREFTTTIRALNADITQIPPVGFPSFLPSKESYAFFQSKPIPIVVQSVDEVTLADAVISGDSPRRRSSATREHTPLTPAPGGIWAHQSASDILRGDRFSYTGFFEDPVIILVTASGPVLFSAVCALGFVQTRKRRRASIIHKAFVRAKKLEHQGRIKDAFSLLTATALGINPDSVVASDAYKLPIDAQLAEQVVDALRINDAQTYLSSSKSTPNAASSGTDIQMKGLLKSLHDQLRSHSTEDA